MSDLISRRAAIDAMGKAKWAKERLMELPAVHPDHTADIGKKASISCAHENDLISRQAAIDALRKKQDNGKGDMSRFYNTIIQYDIEAIMVLPSTQPEQVCVANVTLTDEQVKEAVEKAKNAVISVIEPEPHWIPCSEKLPSETVIATVETKVFKHRYVCEAVWIPRWTWKASFYFEWEDCSEYKEEDDEYYVIEGWYERVHNWDEYEYVAIDDNVIAWMPIPIPYCGGNEESITND